jgi:GNAT superfamily N-acetyltransferase
VAEHHRAEEAAARRRRRRQGREQDHRADAGPALSTAHAFGPDYREDVALRDGTRVRLRLIRPDDKERLRAGFARLSPESRYLRFFAPKHQLSDAELRYLTECDGVDHVAIGASRLDDDATDGEGDGLGVARFIRAADDPDVAEAAIAVLDEVQGKGLGTLLFWRLIAAAAERGIARFRCDVLAENAAMVDMIESIAPERTVGVDGGVMTIEFALPAVPHAEPETDHPSRGSPMFRFFRLIAEGASQWRDAVRKR